jgi:hypothetical protein
LWLSTVPRRISCSAARSPTVGARTTATSRIVVLPTLGMSFTVALTGLVANQRRKHPLPFLSSCTSLHTVKCNPSMSSMSGLLFPPNECLVMPTSACMDWNTLEIGPYFSIISALRGARRRPAQHFMTKKCYLMDVRFSVVSTLP